MGLGPGDLRDDLTGVEVAVETELPGGAEGAPQRTSGLARHAKGGTTRVRHQDCLECHSVRGPEQPLHRRSAITELLDLHVERPEVSRQSLPECAGEIGHLLGREHRRGEQPAAQLVGAVGRFPFEEPAEILGRDQVEQRPSGP